MEPKKKFEIIEESRFLNVDEYGLITGGVAGDACKIGEALYLACTGAATLSAPRPCVLHIKPCEITGDGGKYVVCIDGKYR